MFNEPAPCAVPNIDHYREAISEAVMGSEQHLKTTYDRAMTKDTSDYEKLLWAMADHPDFMRSTESVYESYLQLFGAPLPFRDKADGTPLDRATVVTRLNALKGPSRGCILTSASGTRGWYQFRESITRRYARLRAEEQGVHLIHTFCFAHINLGGRVRTCELLMLFPSQGQLGFNTKFR